MHLRYIVENSQYTRIKLIYTNLVRLRKKYVIINIYSPSYLKMKLKRTWESEKKMRTIDERVSEKNFERCSFVHI